MTFRPSYTGPVDLIGGSGRPKTIHLECYGPIQDDEDTHSGLLYGPGWLTRGLLRGQDGPYVLREPDGATWDVIQLEPPREYRGDMRDLHLLQFTATRRRPPPGSHDPPL